MSYYRNIMKKGGVVLSKGRICNACKQEIQREMLDRNLSICPQCGCYLRMHARRRILSLADKKSFREWNVNMKFSNPLNDNEYAQKAVEASLKHKLNDAIITGEMDIDGLHVAIGVMDTRYMMASMGYVVGEKITRLFEKATKKKLPVIMFCCSGGARMQEGIISLMQMEKTAAAVKKHSEAGLLYISVLTNPTMGGVTASFAMLADIVLVEKGARIGFAGARVIEQNIGEKLAKNFQTADFQLEHGFIDAILDRHDVRNTLGNLLNMHRTTPRKNYKVGINAVKLENYVVSEKSGWERVKVARQFERPTSKDFIDKLFTNFYEMHGDRLLGDDNAIIAGIAMFNGIPITVIGNQKGKHSMKEAIYRNFGMASPQGFRKALRLAKQAEKFNRPIVFFVDTIGAACGEAAEENGQGIAIANLLQEMSIIKVPVLSIIIGEGGSGGALAFCVGNEVWMLENSIYSIISPEAYASIVWKDKNKAKDAANIMGIGADDLCKMKIIDYIVRENTPVTRDDMDTVCQNIEEKLKAFLFKYRGKTQRSIVEERFQRFRKY